jgi:hypothetical protein
MAIEDTPLNQDLIQGWVNKWYKLALPAIRAFYEAFAEKQSANGKRRSPKILDQIEIFYTGYLESMRLRVPV